jgi:hypothetical protein
VQPLTAVCAGAPFPKFRGQVSPSGRFRRSLVRSCEAASPTTTSAAGRAGHRNQARMGSRVLRRPRQDVRQSIARIKASLFIPKKIGACAWVAARLPVEKRGRRAPARPERCAQCRSTQEDADPGSKPARRLAMSGSPSDPGFGRCEPGAARQASNNPLLCHRIHGGSTNTHPGGC